jgi:hypothetical protein
MTLKSILLPLYEESDYFYNVTIERVSYRFRFYYNERMKQWILDIYLSDKTPIILGVCLVPSYPMLYDYLDVFNGFLWLSPIGGNKNETISNPFELSKYYNLYYITEE